MTHHAPRTIKAKVCIVGLGPAGLGAAVHLCRSPLAEHLVCLEAGADVHSRSDSCAISKGDNCCRQSACHVISGVGGASALGGCKISAFPAGTALTRYMGGAAPAAMVLESALARFREYAPTKSSSATSAAISALTAHYKKMGFTFRYYDACLCDASVIRAGYAEMLRQVGAAGAQLCLNTTVKRIERSGAGYRVAAVVQREQIAVLCDFLILAVGRSGGSLLRAVNDKLPLGLTAQRFEAGIRLEFPAALWPDIDVCHNDLKLVFGPARTFCVCKNGHLVPYQYAGMLMLDGHVDIDRPTGMTNLAVLVRSPVAGKEEVDLLMQNVRKRIRRLSAGKPVRQMLRDYLDGGIGSEKALAVANCSLRAWTHGNVSRVYPKCIQEPLHRAVTHFAATLLPGEAHSVTSVIAPAIEYFWPAVEVRHGFTSRQRNLYVVGDCTGQFRGILQAFSSGMFCADHLLGQGHV